jgi:hypothetical protein
MMMHKDQTHIKRNCFSIGIISSKLQSGCYKSYPLKNNLVPEICKKEIHKDWFRILVSHLVLGIKVLFKVFFIWICMSSHLLCQMRYGYGKYRLWQGRV